MIGDYFRPDPIEGGHLYALSEDMSTVHDLHQELISRMGKDWVGCAESTTRRGILLYRLENEVKEPNISITVQYTTETVVELSLQTLNEWKNNSLPDTMTDVLKSEIKGCYYVEEWEVL